MSKFIKLTNFLLNTRDIHRIDITPNKYYIQIASKQIYGSTISLFGAGRGILESHTAEIEVCQTKHATDYKIVTDWIDKISKNF